MGNAASETRGITPIGEVGTTALGARNQRKICQQLASIGFGAAGQASPALLLSAGAELAPAGAFHPK